MAAPTTRLNPQAVQPLEEETETSRVRALHRRWFDAIGDGVPGDLDGLLLPRSVLIPPGGEPVKGGEAVIDWWRRTLDLPDFRFTFEPRRLTVYPAGNVAHDIGRYRIGFDGEDGRVGDRGDHLLLWERTDGEWQVRSNVLYSRNRNGVRLPS